MKESLRTERNLDLVLKESKTLFTEVSSQKVAEMGREGWSLMVETSLTVILTRDFWSENHTRVWGTHL